MNFRFRWAICAVAAAMSVLASANTDAQVIRSVRGRGIAVNVPGINLRVGPVSIPGTPYLAPRARVLGIIPYVGVAPYVGVGPYAAPAPSAAPAAADAASLPSAAEIAAMDDSTLLNFLLYASNMLDDDLGRFTTAAGWQNHLRLPDDALPPPAGGRVTLGFGSLRRTLDRFNVVAANGAYAQIFSLPSFAATHKALIQVVSRFAGQAPVFGAPPSGAPSRPATADPAGGAEELPAPKFGGPALVAPAQSAGAERAILSK